MTFQPWGTSQVITPPGLACLGVAAAGGAWGVDAARAEGSLAAGDAGSSLPEAGSGSVWSQAVMIPNVLKAASARTASAPAHLDCTHEKFMSLKLLRNAKRRDDFLAS